MCPCVRLSVCPFVCLYNGHAWRKKHVVELYRLLRMLNITPLGEALGKEANSAHIAGLDVTENQQDRRQDREDSGRDLEAEGREGNKSASKES